LLNAPCHLARFLASAEKKIGAGRADDRRAGVLRYHEATKRRRVGRARQRQICFDEERRAVDVQGLVDRNRAPCGQRNALGADCFSVVVQSDDAEEHNLPVLPANRLGPVRIVVHPLPDALNGSFLSRHQVTLDQQARHRNKWIPIMRVVTDAQQGTVLKTHARGTLNLDRQGIGGAAEPTDFEVLPVERAILDLAAVVIRDEFTGWCLTEGPPAIWKWSAGDGAGRDEIARAAVQRHGELPGRKSRPIHNRFVVAGEKACGIAELADSHRHEIRLEELSCRPRIKLPSGDGASTHLFERGAYRSGLRWGTRGPRTNGPFANVGVALSGPLTSVGCGLGSNGPIARRMELRGLGAQCVRARDWTATSIERRKSARMIVAGPAVEVAPVDRFQCGIENSERP
jgi:hypothetical protein